LETVSLICKEVVQFATNNLAIIIFL